MPAIFVYRNGQWREAQGLYPRNANAWKTGNKAWVRSGGAWRLVFERLVEITLSSNTGALVVAPNTLPGTSGIVAGQTLRINVPAGVVIRGGNTSQTALTIQGWPAGVSIQLNVGGTITGAGGFGGRGGTLADPRPPTTAGLPGGTALILRSSCALLGAGQISGGGGGGGGGGARVAAGGGGGGGGGTGAGGDTGVGGPAGAHDPRWDIGSQGYLAASGQQGGRPGGGAGGRGGYRSPGYMSLWGGDGGAGGNAGSPGAPGGDSRISGGEADLVAQPAPGGAAGPAIDGASNVTNLAGTSVSLVGPRIN